MTGEIKSIDERLKRYKKGMFDFIYAILFFSTKIFLNIILILFALLGIISLVYPQTREPLIIILKETYKNIRELLII